MEIGKERLAQAITKAELHTTGDIVPVIVPQSDHYEEAHWKFSVPFSFIVTYLCYLYCPTWDVKEYFLIQFVSIMVGFALAYFAPIKRRFIDKKVAHQETFERALHAFHQHGLEQCEQKNGILILISLLERKVHILAGQGIHEKVSPDTWKNIVKKLTAKLKKGDLTTGLENAILECGEILAKHFPGKSSSKNRFENKIIEEK